MCLLLVPSLQTCPFMLNVQKNRSLISVGEPLVSTQRVFLICFVLRAFWRRWGCWIPSINCHAGRLHNHSCTVCIMYGSFGAAFVSTQRGLLVLTQYIVLTQYTYVWYTYVYWEGFSCVDSRGVLVLTRPYVCIESRQYPTGFVLCWHTHFV